MKRQRISGTLRLGLAELPLFVLELKKEKMWDGFLYRGTSSEELKDLPAQTGSHWTMLAQTAVHYAQIVNSEDDSGVVLRVEPQAFLGLTIAPDRMLAEDDPDATWVDSVRDWRSFIVIGNQQRLIDAAEFFGVDD